MDIVDSLRFGCNGYPPHSPTYCGKCLSCRAAAAIERLRADLERCESERLQLVDELRAAERRADEADRELLRLGVLP